MTWIFKPDGEILEVTGWPSPGAYDIPTGSWGYPSFSGRWGLVHGSIWVFPGTEQVPKDIRAKALLLS